MPPCQRPFAISIHVYMCVHACASMCIHVCTCAYVWGHPHAPNTSPTHLPPSKSYRGPKHQNSISLELIEIIQFCLKILYLWILLNSYRLNLFTPDTPHQCAPPPRAEETQIRRITITLEWIKIIQFCLKIWDPWTLLHTYKLDLMCRWGGVLLQNALLCLFAPVTLW